MATCTPNSKYIFFDRIQLENDCKHWKIKLTHKNLMLFGDRSLQILTQLSFFVHTMHNVTPAYHTRTDLLRTNFLLDTNANC